MGGIVCFIETGSGNDTYLAGRGTGQDIIDNHGEGGSADRVLFDAGIARDQLWFQSSGNDLIASVIGTSAKLTIRGWNDSANQVAEFQTAGGDHLLAAQVNNLVQAMAAFSPPPLGQTTLSTEQNQAIEIVVAENWRHGA